MGGFILEMKRREAFASVWAAIKLRLCGDQNTELKWSHFFPGFHQSKSRNPLLSSEPQEWRQQAIWAISELFRESEITAVNTGVRNDKASKVAFVTKEDGRRVLDINTLWVGVIGQFALFLKEHDSRGTIWFDQLGSREEEARRQADWVRLRDGDWSLNAENQVVLQRIAPTLKFFDSQTEPLVQIADFVSGVIWAASEGDDEFLLSTLTTYFPKGPHTYTLVHYE